MEVNWSCLHITYLTATFHHYVLPTHRLRLWEIYIGICCASYRCEISITDKQICMHSTMTQMPPMSEENILYAPHTSPQPVSTDHVHDIAVPILMIGAQSSSTSSSSQFQESCAPEISAHNCGPEPAMTNWLSVCPSCYYEYCDS